MNPIKINVAKNETEIYATKVGNVSCETEDGQNIMLRNALYVADLPKNLLSFSRLDHLGIKLNIDNGIANVLQENGKKLFSVILGDRDLYEVTFFVNSVEQINAIESNGFDSIVWHKRFGHLNQNYLEKWKIKIWFLALMKRKLVMMFVKLVLEEEHQDYPSKIPVRPQIIETLRLYRCITSKYFENRLIVHGSFT